MRYPNLVIAGAPKCGTSSVFTWLAAHPQVGASTVKETFYLMDEGHPLRRQALNFQEQGLAGYESFFSKCLPHHRVVFEATTHYLYQQTALEVLSRLKPMPQIVFLLRKPSERVYSSFQYSKHNLANVRRDLSFAQFITEVMRRPDSALISEYAGESAFVLQRDIEYSRYIEHLSRWIARFGRERIQIYLFEEMKRDPRLFMQTLAGRLGIAAEFYDRYDFPVRNETVTVRNTSLHRRVKKLNRAIPRFPMRSVLKNTYMRAQSHGNGKTKSAEDQQTLNELEQYFVPLNQRLAKDCDLDLSAWH